MADGGYYQGRPPEQRYSAVAPRDNPRKALGYLPAATSGHGRLAMGSHAQPPTYQGGPGMSPNNPGKGGDSTVESFASNRFAQSQKVYFPSANDLRLGAQGYSSCSDRDQLDGRTESHQPDETISRSGQGADTYAGHLPSSNCGYGDQPSTKRSSKAYGMEHGHWLGMDASIQNTTLQDTTCLKNLSRDEALNNYKNRSNQDIAYSSNQRGIGKDWLYLGGHAAVNRSNQNPNRPPASLGGESSPLPSRMAVRTSPERNMLQGLHPAYAPLKGSTLLDETLQLMNQTQNKTIYQVTQSAQRRGAGGHSLGGGDYFKQVWTPRKDEAATGAGGAFKRFNITFKVFYKTDYGESLQVVGSIEELGAWKDYKCPLKWTEGHIWVSETLSIKSCSHFTYKYVIMYQQKAVKWERGPHRIADLVILPDVNRMQKPKEQNSFSASPDSRYSGKRSHYSLGMNSVGLPQSSAAAGGRYSSHNQNVQLQPATKNVELRDRWEQFTIRFSVLAPINMTVPQNDSSLESCKEYMRIIGSAAELTKSGTIESGPRRMKKSRKKFRWLFDKYGQEMCPWECQVTLKTSDFIETRELIYSYSKSDHAQRDYIYEREPSRIMKLQQPETYRGELGAQRSSQWRNWDKVWIVNGHVEKVDGNFLGELFYTKVGETGICLGTYPLEDQDVQRLYQAGITGVLNVMTLNDLRQRGVQLRQIQRSYEERGMKCVKFPVNDIKDKDLQSNLFIAAQHLNNMVNLLGLNVYVHCTSGLTRAPAVILAYLCLFKKIKCWQTPDEALKYIRTFNPKLNPNMRIIKKCIEANKEFQMSQPESQGQNKRLLDSLEDSFYFPNMIIEESNHNPMKLEKLLDISNQIQEEEESFDTNQGPDRQPSQRSGNEPVSGPLQHPIDLSAINPRAPGSIMEPPITSARTGGRDTQTMEGSHAGGSHQAYEGNQSVAASIDDAQIQKKIDEEVAIKLNQKLEGLREQIIQEQEEKMRQTIQEVMNQSQKQHEDQQKEQQKLRVQQELELEKARAQQRLEEEEARRLEAVKTLQEEASRAQLAREQEERRTRQLELEIEQLKLREQERLREMQAEKERLEQEVQQAKNAKEARDLELEQRQEREELLQKREQQAKLEAEQLAHQLREEMEQKMKENLEKLVQEQLRQSKLQEQQQKQRELKMEQEKKDIEELIRKQKMEEERRNEDKMLRKRQKQEERDRQQQQLEAEKIQLSQQMLLQQQEIQRLQASLNQEADRIKTFERLEQSHQSLSRLEQIKREEDQKQALEVVEQLRRELQDQQERQKLVEATTAQQLKQKDEVLREIEKAKEDDLRKEAEARQRQEQLLKAEMESKLAAEQQAEQQKRAIQQLQLQLEHEKGQTEMFQIKQQQRAQENEEQLPREIDQATEKGGAAAAEVESLQKEEQTTKTVRAEYFHSVVSISKQSDQEKNDEQDVKKEQPSPSRNSKMKQLMDESANLYYRATSGTELEESSPIIVEANEQPEEHAQQFYVKKRRDRRNRDRSGSKNRGGQGNAKQTSLPQIDSFVANNANPSEIQPQALCANNNEEQPQIERPQQRPPERGPINEELASSTLDKVPTSKLSNAVRQQRAGSKSSLTRLAEEEQFVAAERLQKIKKKKEENALRQAQIQEQEQEMKNLEQRKRAQEEQLEELLRMRDLERQKQEETKRRIAQEQTRSALKAVVDDILQEHVRKEIEKLCQNRIEVETEVQNVLRQREQDETEESREYNDILGQKEGQVSRKDHIAKKKEMEGQKRLQMANEPSKDGENFDHAVDESKYPMSVSEEELQRIRNLRILEEEKLNLLRLAKEVEDQRSILKSKHSLTELTLNQSLAAQVQEIPDPSSPTGQSKRQLMVVEDESLQLDYQREEKEGIYGMQERKAEFSAARRVLQHYGSPQADGAKNRLTDPKQQHAFDDGRGAAVMKSFNPSAGSFAKDSMNQGASTPNRASLFQQQKNLLDLTDLQFEQMCDEFFSDGPPIKFKARRGIKIEEQIQKTLKKEKITLPIIHVRASLYLIGAQKCICELKGDLVMVRQQGVAAGQVPQRLQKFLIDNQKAQQRTLCKMMLQSKMQFEDVCQALIKGQKIGDESKQLPQLGALSYLSAQTYGAQPQASRAPAAKLSSLTGAMVERKGQAVRQQADANLGAPGHRTNTSGSRQAMAPLKGTFDFNQRTSSAARKLGPVNQMATSRQGDRPGDSAEPRLAATSRQLGMPDAPRSEVILQDDVKKTMARPARASRPMHVAPVKQLQLALKPGDSSASRERQTSRYGSRTTSTSQDPTRIRGVVGRTKQQLSMTSGASRRIDPQPQLQKDEPPVQKAQATPDSYMAKSKRNKAAIVPEKQIRMGGQTGRAERPPSALQTQRAGASRGRQQSDDNKFLNSQMHSYRGSEASTVHRPEGQRGDYSFRSNLDLFNQDKQYQQSRVLPDQSQSQVGSADGEDAKSQKAQMAQMGYLNALNEFTREDNQELQKTLQTASRKSVQSSSFQQAASGKANNLSPKRGTATTTQPSGRSTIRTFQNRNVGKTGAPDHGRFSLPTNEGARHNRKLGPPRHDHDDYDGDGEAG